MLRGCRLFLGTTPWETEGDGHFHNDYIVLDTVSYPYIVQNVQGGVFRLYLNTVIM